MNLSGKRVVLKKKTNTSLPFNLSHPELNLMTYSDADKQYFSQIRFNTNGLEWGFTHADYVERPSDRGTQYLYVVKNEKLGIVKWWYHDNIWGTSKTKCELVIPCKYDKIDKHSDMFVCYKKGETFFYDLQGKRMK